MQIRPIFPICHALPVFRASVSGTRSWVVRGAHPTAVIMAIISDMTTNHRCKLRMVGPTAKDAKSTGKPAQSQDSDPVQAYDFDPRAIIVGS